MFGNGSLGWTACFGAAAVCTALQAPSPALLFLVLYEYEQQEGNKKKQIRDVRQAEYSQSLEKHTPLLLVGLGRSLLWAAGTVFCSEKVL